MTADLLVTINSGSSTIKLGLFATGDGHPHRIGHGMIDLRRTPLVLHFTEAPTTVDIELEAEFQEDLHDVIKETLDWLASHFGSKQFVAAGHRVVHGGDRFLGPTRIDDETLAAIAALCPLAPLHQPRSVRLIEAIRRSWPGVLQTASFDTAFHRSQSEEERRFAIPRQWFDEGVKRYGFHGLSYQYIAGALSKENPELAAGKVVVAHLGSGASLCAMEGGISLATSMGFSTLDGIPMATRSGSLDPGVILHLLKEQRMDVEQLEDMLYNRSGLLGLSGISADARVLAESSAPEAGAALDIFARSIAQYVAAYATTLGGLDGVIFTAGIGEHQPALRDAVCRRLAWMGVRLDAQSNEANALRIDAPSSSIAVYVLPTDEEQIIADEAFSLLLPSDEQSA